MKKLLSLGLAAVVAASALAVVPSTASAKSGFFFGMGPMNPYPYYPYYGYRHYHRSPGAYFSFGGPDFRFSFGMPVHPSYRYSYSYANPHVAWCAAHFRTYNPATNLYFAKKGVAVACISPYAY